MSFSIQQNFDMGFTWIRYERYCCYNGFCISLVRKWTVKMLLNCVGLVLWSYSVSCLAVSTAQSQREVVHSTQEEPFEKAVTYVSSVINFSQQPERRVPKVKRQAETTTPPPTTPEFSNEDDTVEQPETTEKPKTKITIDFLGDNASPPFGRNPFQIAQNLPGDLFKIGLTAARKTAQNAVDFGSNQFTTISEAGRNTAGGFGHLFSSGFTSLFCKMFLQSPGCKFLFGA